MKLAQSKKEQWEKTLKELELMGADDVIEEHTQGDLWTFMSQTSVSLQVTNGSGTESL